jgi:hypothetical protein
MAVATLATCASGRAVLAFDKQTCAVAYENAQQLRSKLKLRRARDQLLICGHSSCPGVVTKDCNLWLDEVELELTSVVFRVRDSRGQELADVRVSMDGEHLRDRLDATSVFVDPGMHVFRFESKGGAAVEVRQMLRKGDRDRAIELTLKPSQDEPRWQDPEFEKADAGFAAGRTSDARADDRNGETKPPVELQLVMPGARSSAPGVGTYVAAGIGALALSSAVYFGLKAKGDTSDLLRTCAPNCAPSDVDPVRSELLAANVSLGIGLVALGVAGALWLVQGSASARPASSLRFDVVPTARGQGAALVTTLSAP